MAVTAIATTETTPSPDLVTAEADLGGHRLAELVQVLTGCRVEDAELAVSHHDHRSRVTPDEALATVARALVDLRRPAARSPRR